MILGQWKKDPQKAITSDEAGTHIIGSHPTPLKEGYGEDAWGRRIRDAYFFDLVYPNPRGDVGGWTPQIYTQGFRYNALGSEGLSQDMSLAKTTDQASKMAKQLGLPGPNEALAGQMDQPLRLMPSTISPLLMAAFNARTYGDFWNDQYRQNNPDDFWLFEDVGELSPDNMTILPRGTAQKQAEHLGGGEYVDKYNTTITLKDGKRYVESAPPSKYGADIKRDNPGLYNKMLATTGRLDEPWMSTLGEEVAKNRNDYQNLWKDLQRSRGYLFKEDDPIGASAPQSAQSIAEAQLIMQADNARQQQERGQFSEGGIGSDAGYQATQQQPQQQPQQLGNEWEGQKKAQGSASQSILDPKFGGNDVAAWGGWIPKEKDYDYSIQEESPYGQAYSESNWHGGSGW